MNKLPRSLLYRFDVLEPVASTYGLKYLPVYHIWLQQLS